MSAELTSRVVTIRVGDLCPARDEVPLTHVVLRCPVQSGCRIDRSNNLSVEHPRIEHGGNFVRSGLPLRVDDCDLALRGVRRSGRHDPRWDTSPDAGEVIVARREQVDDVAEVLDHAGSAETLDKRHGFRPAIILSKLRVVQLEVLRRFLADVERIDRAVVAKVDPAIRVRVGCALLVQLNRDGIQHLLSQLRSRWGNAAP